MTGEDACPTKAEPATCKQSGTGLLACLGLFQHPVACATSAAQLSFASWWAAADQKWRNKVRDRGAGWNSSGLISASGDASVGRKFICVEMSRSAFRPG